MIVPINFQKKGLSFVRIKSMDKKPIDEEWTTKNNYAYNDLLITKHKGNIGILLGKVIAIDCDDIEAEKLARILPETLIIGTSMNGEYRKKHFYFQLPEPMKRKVLEKDGRHIGEVQAQGQQCIIPPSIHPSGITYDVLEDREIAKITEAQLMEIIQPYIMGGKAKVFKNKTEAIHEETDEECAEIKKNIKLSDIMIKYGIDVSRNPSMCPWHKCSNPCFSWNDSTGLWNCFDTECLRSGNIFHLVMLHEGVPFVEAKKKLAEFSGIGKEKTAEGDVSSDIFFKIAKNKEGKVIGKRFVSKFLGDYIQKFTHFKTLIGNQQVYVYNDGLYQPTGADFIKSGCKNLLDDEFTKNRVNETIAYIQAGTHTNPDEIDNGWINLENGLLNPDTMEFIDHTPDIFTIRRIPIAYDPDADCPMFKEKLAEKVDINTMTVLQEMFGYCFMPGQRFEVAFMLYGPRQTMKSTTLYILENMMGKENVRAFSLQYLTEKDFAAAYLYGCPVNICADLSAKSLKNTGVFMTWTGGDLQTAAKKGEHPITWSPSTKLIFSCNQIPGTPNKDLAYYRRWIALNFPKQTKKEDIDSSMRVKLLEELPGILNWALSGLARLKENGKTSYWLDEYGVKDLYERNADTISSFIYSEVDTEDDSGKAKKRDIYKAYIKYCDGLGLTPENQIKFGRVFKEVTGCGTSRINDIPSYTGVKMRDEEHGQKTLDV